MCDWGNDEIIEIDGKHVAVDLCIAPLIEGLNRGGIATSACCCGHGKSPGSVMLVDGRELLVLPNYASARRCNAILESHKDNVDLLSDRRDVVLTQDDGQVIRQTADPYEPQINSVNRILDAYPGARIQSVDGLPLSKAELTVLTINGRS